MFPDPVLFRTAPFVREEGLSWNGLSIYDLLLLFKK